MFRKVCVLVNVEYLLLESLFLRFLSRVGVGRLWPKGGDRTRSAYRSSAIPGGVCGAGKFCSSVEAVLPLRDWCSSCPQQQEVGLTRLCLRRQQRSLLLSSGLDCWGGVTFPNCPCGSVSASLEVFSPGSLDVALSRLSIFDGLLRAGAGVHGISVCRRALVSLWRILAAHRVGWQRAC